MGRYWSISCPFCKAEMASGRGYGDQLPKVWVPYIRCNICGNLVSTGVSEFLTLKPEERQNIRASLTNCESIAQSLDRTNNNEYISFLEKHGFEIYPITQADKDKFKNVDFDNYENAEPTEDATDSLYNVGILIKAEDLDEETGGIKKEKLAANQEAYNLTVMQNKYGVIAGFTVGILSCIILGTISPNSYLFVLGILLGFGAHFLTAYCIQKSYENKKKLNSEENVETEIQEQKTNYRLEKSETATLDLETSNSQKKIASLKKLYEEGIISQEEYKEKALKIIDDNND